MPKLEKDFGQIVEEVALVSTDDLLSLQTAEDVMWEGFSQPTCTFCSWTCWNTAK